MHRYSVVLSDSKYAYEFTGDKAIFARSEQEAIITATVLVRTNYAPSSNHALEVVSVRCTDPVLAF